MSYRVEPLRLSEHRDQLFGVWAENMTDARIADVMPARCDWLYGNNPAGSTQTWVVIHGEAPGSVVGCTSFVPRALSVPGGVIGGGVMADFAVSQSHRSAGPAVKVLRAASNGAPEHGCQVLFGYPNANSTPIFKRVRFKPVGDSRDWKKPLRSEYKVREKIPQPQLARVAAHVFDAAYRAWDWVAQVDWSTPLPSGPRAHRSQITTSADSEFDSLWARCLPRLVTGEKTSAYLNWRYAEFTTADYEFFRLYGPESDELLGFVVYKVVDNRVLVADLFCDFLRHTELLLFAFSEGMRAAGHELIHICYLGNRFFDDALRAQHFIEQDKPRTLFAQVSGDASEGLRERIFNEDNWFMLDGDLDI